MAVELATGEPEGGYAVLFRQYIQRGVQARLAAVRNAGPALPAEEREQSLHTLEFALDLPDAWPEARALLIVLAPKLDQAGVRQDWLPFLQRGIEQCQENGDEAGQAEMELHLGLLLMVMGRMEEAHRLFSASAGRFQALGDWHNQARALNRWAYIDHLQHETASAGRLVHQALSLVGPDDTETSYGQFVLGSLARDRHDWPEALSYLQQALEGWQRHGDPVMIARSLTNLGTAQRGAGQIDRAIASFTQAIELMQTVDDPVNEATTRINLGNAYWALGQPEKALNYYLQAEPVFRMTQDNLRLARVNTTIGIVAIQLGQWDRAQAALETAIDLSRMLGDRRAVANAMDALGELHLRQGQPGAALAILQQALEELAGLYDDPDVAARYADVYAEIVRHIEEAHAAAQRPGA